jgi:hypothetical protein
VALNVTGEDTVAPFAGDAMLTPVSEPATVRLSGVTKTAPVLSHACTESLCGPGDMGMVVLMLLPVVV